MKAIALHIGIRRMVRVLPAAVAMLALILAPAGAICRDASGAPDGCGMDRAAACCCDKGADAVRGAAHSFVGIADSCAMRAAATPEIVEPTGSAPFPFMVGALAVARVEPPVVTPHAVCAGATVPVASPSPPPLPARAPPSFSV